MHRPGKFLLLCMLLCAWLGSVSAQEPRVDVELSSPIVAMGESVSLQIVAYALDGELDITSLETDFDVVGRSSSRQVNIVNGKRSSTVIWNIDLQPKRVGKQILPPIKVGPLSSQPLALEVTAAAAGGDRQIFMQASIDNAEPYVQAQVIYTVKIYQRLQFSGDSLGYPNAEGVTVQQLGEDKQYTEEVEGQSYGVFERRFVLFPQSSGIVEIPPVVLQGSVPGRRSNRTGLFSPRKRFTRQTNPVSLNVKQRPDSFTGQWWLPATEVELSADWATQDTPVVGQPLTRIVTLVANGVGEIQLPEIAPPELSDASVYTDASDASTTFVVGGLQAQRQFSWAIIPQQAGSLTLPEITVQWFDVINEVMQTAVVPTETIEVEPAAMTNSAATTRPISQEPPQQVTPNLTTAVIDDGSALTWKRIAGTLAFGWLATVMLWAARTFWPQRSIASTKKPTARPHMPIHVAAVQAAVKEHDIQAMVRAVKAWGSAAYQLQTPSLGEIGNRVASTTLKSQLTALDAAAYRPGNDRLDAATFNELATLLKAEKTITNDESDTLSGSKHALPAL